MVDTGRGCLSYRLMEHSPSDNTAEQNNAAYVAAVSEFTTEESLQKSRAAQTKLLDVVRLGWIDASKGCHPVRLMTGADRNNRSIDPRVGGLRRD